MKEDDITTYSNYELIEALNERGLPTLELFLMAPSDIFQNKSGNEPNVIENQDYDDFDEDVSNLASGNLIMQLKKWLRFISTHLSGPIAPTDTAQNMVRAETILFYGILSFANTHAKVLTELIKETQNQKSKISE